MKYMSHARSAALCVTIATAATALAGTAYYSNDFTTRTSNGLLPATNVWHEIAYPEGSYNLCNRPFEGDAQILANYYDSAETDSRSTVNGWYIPNFNNGRRLLVKHYPAEENTDVTSSVFSFRYGSDTARDGYAIHPLHNEFTNGYLRIQVDMKTPVQWNKASSFLMVGPIYKKYLEIMEWNASENTDSVSPGHFGIRSSADSSALARQFAAYKYTSSSTIEDFCNLDNSSFSSLGETNRWTRLIATFDIVNNTFEGQVYRFKNEQGHPTFDTTPYDTTAFRDITNIEGIAPMTAESGGIAGLCITCYGSYAPNNASDDCKPLVDNVRISWKAPGESDFTVFYEDDFDTLKYRTITGSDSEGSYTATATTSDDTDTYTFSDYPVNKNLNGYRTVPKWVNGNTVSQPSGLDGWKILPYTDVNGNGRPGVMTYGGTDADAQGVGTNMFIFGYDGAYSLLGQTLGQSFTNGKVRIVADFRAPSVETSYTQGYQRNAIGLGSAALYTSDQTNLAANLAAGAGYLRVQEDNVSHYEPYTLATSESAQTPAYNTISKYTPLETNWWYRYEIEANLDAKTYSYTVTPIGAWSVTSDFTPTNTAILTQTSLSFASSSVTDIGSFYVYAFGYGASGSTAQYMDRRTCIDNICVYHDDDLVYYNDFNTRTRTVTGATRAPGITSQQYNIDAGQDHWVRRDYIGVASLRTQGSIRDDDGNTYLSIGRELSDGGEILLANEFGTALDIPFVFSADIRPPQTWNSNDGVLTFALGDSQMAQTEACTNLFENNSQILFGFNAPSNSSYGSPYCFAGATATVGGTDVVATIELTHWYRFRAKVDPASETYTVNIYDMGTTHPGISDANGTLVATVENVEFKNALSDGDGIASMNIYATGLRGEFGSTGLDEGHALVDNVKVESADGLYIFVR